MTYEQIDEVLEPWARDRNLTVKTVMRDEPIRLLGIKDARGDLSIDPSGIHDDGC